MINTWMGYVYLKYKFYFYVFYVLEAAYSSQEFLAQRIFFQRQIKFS